MKVDDHQASKDVGVKRGPRTLPDHLRHIPNDTLTPGDRDVFLGSIALVACLLGDPLDRAAVESTTHQDNASGSAAGGPCPGDYTVPVAWLHRPWLFTPRTDPQGTGPVIRDMSGYVDCLAKGKGMHIEAADHIPMPHKGASRTATAPDASPDFLFPPAYRTPARCSPLRASEARDVG